MLQASGQAFTFSLTRSVESDTLSSLERDDVISRQVVFDAMENELRATSRLSVASQDQLREMLQRECAAMQREETDRIRALLNPRNAPVIHLTDAESIRGYWRTSPDNYSSSCVSFADRLAEFDASHGYYVSLKADLID